MSGHGHACPACAGVGTVRVSGQPGWVRAVCPRCGGSGLLRPTSGYTDALAAAWAENPAGFVAAVLATPVVVYLVWALLVGIIVAGQP